MWFEDAASIDDTDFDSNRKWWNQRHCQLRHRRLSLSILKPQNFQLVNFSAIAHGISLAQFNPFDSDNV